jgi:hypothetical protein
MTSIRDIIRDIVEGLSFTQSIDNLIDNGDGTYTIEVCKTYHVQALCSVITIGGTDYPVTAVVDNTSITISSTSAPVGDSYTIAAPFYFAGTRIAVNNKLSLIESYEDKMPLVFLWEVLQEGIIKDPESRLDQETTVRLFFLAPRDKEINDTDTLYTDSVDPMGNLLEAFVDSLEGNVLILDDNIDRYDRLALPKFGVTSDEGAKDSFFNEYLSGLELRITLPILKKFTGGTCGCE